MKLPPVRLSEVLARLLLFARGLGFVFLVYFIPAVLRDVLGDVAPGGGFPGLLTAAPGGPWIPLGISVVTFTLSAAFVVLYTRRGSVAVEPRPLVHLDRSWFREWRHGFLFGAGAASLAVLPPILVGATRIHGVSAQMLERPDVLFAIAFALVIEAAREEFGFRGPAQRDLSVAVGFPLAAVFLAGSFAVIHGGNPDIGGRGIIGILLAGLALAGVVRARGDLGMACGAHAGWNVFVGIVWSQPVSGYRFASSLLNVESVGSDSWTGGTFGVEGSVPGIVVLALLGFFTWKLSVRAGDPIEADDGRTPDPAGTGLTGARED